MEYCYYADAFFLERTLRNTMYIPISPAETARAIHETGIADEVSKINGSEVPSITAPLALKVDKAINSKKPIIIFIVWYFW